MGSYAISEDSAVLSETPDGKGGSVTSTSSPTCVYDVPSGTQANLLNYAEMDMGVGFQISRNTGATFDSTTTDKLYLANFEVVGAPFNVLGDSSWQNKSTVAAKCALWMCVQRYTTRMTDANQSQAVIQESSTVESSNTAESMGA